MEKHLPIIQYTKNSIKYHKEYDREQAEIMALLEEIMPKEFSRNQKSKIRMKLKKTGQYAASGNRCVDSGFIGIMNYEHLCSKCASDDGTSYGEYG